MNSNLSHFARSSCVSLALLQACTAPVQASKQEARVGEPIRLVLEPEDQETAARLKPLLRGAIARVERYFGTPFPHPFTLTILPDRATFDASFPPEWGLAKTECWMVATGVADGVRLLSPRVWKEEACEHDAADELHVERLLAHELVHVYHGQRNPSPDFVDVTGIDWFVEGLATFASGQLEDEQLLSAREAPRARLRPVVARQGLDGPLSLRRQRLAGRVRRARARPRASPRAARRDLGRRAARADRHERGGAARALARLGAGLSIAVGTPVTMRPPHRS